LDPAPGREEQVLAIREVNDQPNVETSLRFPVCLLRRRMEDLDAGGDVLDNLPLD
jgi:hypothetical protein